MAGPDAFDPDAEAEPPNGQLAEAVERLGRRERDAVIGPDGGWESKFFEGSLEADDSGERFGRGERFASQQVSAREVGDRQRVAVLAVGEPKLAFEVSAPYLASFRSIAQAPAGTVNSGSGTYAESILDFEGAPREKG